MILRGVTWDHPRGTVALEAAAALSELRGGLKIEWDARSLEQFEDQSIDEIAETYDLVVLDHPHLGEAILAGALLPLDDLLPRELISNLSTDTVGLSFASYVMNNQLWAVPLDAATQVAATLVEHVPEAPATWDQVVGLSRRQPVALSLSGPHAFLTFASVCAAFGEPVGTSPDEIVSMATAVEVLEILCELAQRAPSGSVELNPIRTLERMTTEGDIHYVPLIYGYVGYSSWSLQFADAPARSPGGLRGSVIGGTGLALTRRCQVTKELIAHLVWLMSEEMQTRFIPLNDGQPSLRSAWLDPLTDEASKGFYSGTLRTMESATMRPRHDGFIPFQAAGSAIIRSILLDRSGVRSGIERLQEAYRSSLSVRGVNPQERETR